MKIIQCEQGSPEWRRARLGIPTASNFSLILTPKTLKLSEQRKKYMHRLLAEWLTGMPHDEFVTSIMERGSDLEHRARAWYAFSREVEVEEVGLCLTDDERVGASPDGLIGTDGGLEIKCPMAPKCVAYLLGDKIEEEHLLQVQGNMYVTGRKWWDVVPWNPELEMIPPTIVRAERDDAVLNAIHEALRLFNAEMDLAKEHLLSKGCTPAMLEAAR